MCGGLGTVQEETISSGEATADKIDAIDSDKFSLYVAESSLPTEYAGNGVWAKFDLPVNELLCEYRGPAILESAAAEYGSQNKFKTTAPDGTNLNIICDSICSVINDCANIVGDTYSGEDLFRFKTADREDIIPTYDGFSYNAHFVKTALGKILLYSTIPIKADTEIFFPYGRWYWMNELESRLQEATEQSKK
eukprot:CAMPEP_0182498346 /NCGR_PEP_ID=MMETSP1321-20130603/6566_1 /TAXON_ID=91990 /ORGANISM="Bolidomonas sp., Strain RCC1657" /LENGTH=192 /DNA_ID=CAMNT_0024702387 /DNA_START=275 /DNA_END=852 /DNA_ORIENTATION=+